MATCAYGHGARHRTKEQSRLSAPLPQLGVGVINLHDVTGIMLL